MRPIDADALIKWLNDTYCDISKRLWNYNHHVMAMDMIEIIENYPTIEERKHGYWRPAKECTEGEACAEYKCSVCGSYGDWFDMFCRYCGTEMAEEAKND